MPPFSTRLLMTLSVLANTLSSAWGATGADGPPRIAEYRIGFEGRCKVGCWIPIWVGVSGDAAGQSLSVEATVVDSDGVRVSVANRVETGGQAIHGTWPVVLYTQIGKVGSAAQLILRDENGAVLDQVELSPGDGGGSNVNPYRTLPATSELLIQLGGAAMGLQDAVPAADAGSSRGLMQVPHAGALPVDWWGYDAVQVFVLTIDDDGAAQQLARDSLRLAALKQWVALGGRLVILCGGKAVEEVLAEGGALAELIPGEFTEMVRLPDTVPLEHYARSDVPVAPSGARPTILVPQLSGVEGNIEVYAGRRPSELPLVVRKAHGLGEVAFIGVDFTSSPLREWAGRRAFLQAVLQPYLGERGEVGGGQSLVARGYDDLSGALRQRLGRAFDGAAPISFSVVMVLAIAYLLVLGPLDYLFVHRWLGRPWAAWVSFPIIVLVFGFSAMGLSDWRRSESGARVNQLEIVDIDMVGGRARGTFWATLYSPQAERFDLALATPAPPISQDTATLLSWWGLAGVGIGGMQGGGAEAGIIRDGYWHGDRYAALIGMPVLTGSTKSLLARWTGAAPAWLDARLADNSGLIEGSVANQGDKPLQNVRLLYNGWAYRLGNLDPGEKIDVGEEMSPRRAKTIITRDALGSAGQAEQTVFVPDRATARQVVSLMMFYEAAGGFGFAQLANDYQAYCDLSRLLELGRAILVADVPGGGSRLVDTGGQAPRDGAEEAAMYRFVLPVAKNEGGRQ
jgi:hypothetical protein